jgi:hypothetical protein
LCYFKTKKTGNGNLFKGQNRISPIVEVTQAILDDIFWFAEYIELFASHCFGYFECEISRKLLVNPVPFLQLDPNETRQSSVLPVMKTKPSDEHDDKRLIFFCDYISREICVFRCCSKSFYDPVGQGYWMSLANYDAKLLSQPDS